MDSAGTMFSLIRYQASCTLRYCPRRLGRFSIWLPASGKEQDQYSHFMSASNNIDHLCSVSPRPTKMNPYLVGTNIHRFFQHAPECMVRAANPFAPVLFEQLRVAASTAMPTGQHRRLDRLQVLFALITVGASKPLTGRALLSYPADYYRHHPVPGTVTMDTQTRNDVWFAASIISFKE